MAVTPGIDWEKVLLALVGALGGLASAWLTFEITERRRTRMTQRALREALVAELEQAELLTVTNIGKYMYVAPEIDAIADCAAAIRWFVAEGRERASALGVEAPPMSDGVAAFNHLSDEELVGLYMLKGSKEVVGIKLMTPITDSILAGRTAGFTQQQLRTLSGVKWQVSLLAQDADWMKQFFDMTFTANKTNYPIAEANLHNRTKSYARRSLVLLRAIRAALETLGAGLPRYTAPEDLKEGPYRCPGCAQVSRTPFVRCHSGVM